MRILHTADWHLGHRLYNRERTEEHRAALDWLLETIEEEKIDLLIVAGDVFDVTNPSNQARSLYYNFLARLTQSCCGAAVIVGGNHDSARMLDAPRELLTALRLFIVGGVGESIDDQVIHIEHDDKEVVVAAVPFLRERDLRGGGFGQSREERLATLREGICDHFCRVGEAAERIRNERGGYVPIVATGHLFVSGAADDEEKKSFIYQADEQNIEVGQFPDCFDYVALGHVHRAQHIGGCDHVRYAGSLIPLTFVEGRAARSVRLVELSGAGEAVTSRKLHLPAHRPLLRLRAEEEEVRHRLRAAVLGAGPDDITAWAEVRVLTDEPRADLYESLARLIGEAAAEAGREPGLELLRVSTERLTPLTSREEESAVPDYLDELDPEEVFGMLCVTQGCDENTLESYREDFRELRGWIEEKQEA